ncbi:MAG: biopolymer transporter ExbD [Thermoanaerobaculia bacterium]|nr:biopolymer transporter ExbD [Thermoanaerobaculia bacterium]
MKLKKDTISDEIPTSSMADIAFLLIIYFMVTTTFAATRGLDFSLPQEEETQPLVEKEESILIEIRPGGAIYVDDNPMELEDILEDYIKEKLEANPTKPVIIRPDPNAEYGHMVDVFDELRQAEEKIGFEIRNVSIPTQREIDMFWY